ncbi:hypothetical protein B0H17DRAFT_1129357 [Mycena rosella]|uniref:Uncharacterized protein n=1 Tax=Mycena rosella TaxID=1033263 RepID=A0AAD7DUL0_MYCRO|nr:hypothetical protein B0H17DRAFT_1129357 [Mycena rosella]
MVSILSAALEVHLAELGFSSEATAWVSMTVHILHHVHTSTCGINGKPFKKEASRHGPAVGCHFRRSRSHLMCRPVLDQISGHKFESDSQTFDEAEYKVVGSSEAFFTLAAAFSAAGQHREAFNASKIWAGLSFALTWNYINFLHSQLSTMAEKGIPSLSMLADSMLLCPNLTRIYPNKLATHFLGFLQAYVYLCQQSTILGPDTFQKIKPRVVLFGSNQLRSSSSFCLREVPCWTHFMANIFHVGQHHVQITLFPFIRTMFNFMHFEQAILGLDKAVTCLTTGPSVDMKHRWTLQFIHGIFRFVSHSNQGRLLQMKLKLTGHVRTLLELFRVTKPAQTASVEVLHRFYWTFRLVGLLDNALAAIDITRECLHGSRTAENRNGVNHLRLRYWVTCQVFVLWDMGRVNEAVDAAQEAKAMLAVPVYENPNLPDMA